VLGPHPNFNFFRLILQAGMKYRFKSQLLEAQQQAELQANVDQGNHKSVEASSKQVRKHLDKDVRHNFLLPVHPDLVYKIKGALVQPYGIVSQFALTASGNHQLKQRLI
jgi:hypothetical protein